MYFRLKVLIKKNLIEILLFLVALVLSHTFLRYTRSRPATTIPISIHTEKYRPIVKILCLCLTYPGKENYVTSVLETWGPKCDKLLFASLKIKLDVEYVPINISEEHRKNLWIKVRQAFRHAYNFYRDDYDWFLKADDDTYVFMENMKHFLSGYDPNLPHYFGNRFKTFGGYNSGGAGYVLSRKSLEIFNDVMEIHPLKCPENEHPEDMMMGKCLGVAGIHPSPAIDKNIKEFFRCFSLPYLLNSQKNEKKYWVHQYSYYPYRVGVNCCSSHPISFHYSDPEDKYTLHFLKYKLAVSDDK